MKREDETLLIEGLRAGRRGSFQLAVTRYSGAMLATARAIAGPANAEDVVQDAWLTVFERVNSFEGRSSFKTWLQGRCLTTNAAYWCCAMCSKWNLGRSVTN